MKLLGILIGIIIIYFEYQFACWVQGNVNALIPHNEYYGIIHLATIVAHIFILGGIYLYVFILGLGLVGVSVFSRD
jgi:hypothetical protein